MKRYQITWEYLQEGTSELDAENLDTAIVKAPDSVTDFGDPKQFTVHEQWDGGWKVKTVEEVIK